MSDLLVDSGNTRLKWALSDAGTWRTGASTVRERDLPALLDVWQSLPRPDRLVVAHVGEASRLSRLSDWAQRRWQLPLTPVHAQAEFLGVRNRYRDPESLGADRWAALIGVRALTARGACVVDCGTAVTIDLLTDEGEFAGGVIFPGLALLRQALARGTAGLGVAPGNAVHCLARSTADGIAAGTLYGLVGAIERVAREFDGVLGEPARLYITGGDANEVAAHLSRPVQREPDLVLKGLARIAEYLAA